MNKDQGLYCACLRDENRLRCRRRFCKAPSGLETNTCQTPASPAAAFHQTQKTEDTSTTNPSPDLQTDPEASRRRIGHALERKVVCARTCCERAQSIHSTYRRTNGDCRPGVLGDLVKRPRCFPGRRPPSDCKWRNESSRRRRSFDTTSRIVSNDPGSCGE